MVVCPCAGHLGWFSRYRPLPEALYAAASQVQPLLATRQDVVDQVSPSAPAPICLPSHVARPSFSLKTFMVRLLPGRIPECIAERCHSRHGRPNINYMLQQQHLSAVNVVPTYGIIAG